MPQTSWKRVALLTLLLAGSFAMTAPVIAAGTQPLDRSPILKRNPYSRANVDQALRALGRPALAQPHRGRVATEAVLPTDDPFYTYLSFDPSAVTGKLLQQLEADGSLHMMDFPFASPELYSDEYALDETKAAALRDGRMYAVVRSSSPVVQLLEGDPSLNTRVLDELYLPPDDDVPLQTQALHQSGASEAVIARICLLQRPTGFVRYWDNELARLEPVRGMQVWGLVFGIPLYTYTDANGWYRFPYRFSLGTIMGTKAKNPRVNVKPLNTTGPVWTVIPQLIANFIAGSIHIHGWVGACAMRNDVNFDFWEHRQNRYWSQILNAVYFHDLYSQQQGILPAPYDLVIYAHWSDAFNASGFGSASTPLLHQIVSPWASTATFSQACSIFL